MVCKFTTIVTTNQRAHTLSMDIRHNSLTTHSQDCPPTLLRSLRSLRTPASGLRMTTGALWLNATTAPCALSYGYGRASAKRRNCALRAVTKTPLAAFSGYNRGILPLAVRMIIGGGSGQSGRLRRCVCGGSPCARAPLPCALPFPPPPAPPSPLCCALCSLLAVLRAASVAQVCARSVARP